MLRHIYHTDVTSLLSWVDIRVLTRVWSFQPNQFLLSSVNLSSLLYNNCLLFGITDNHRQETFYSICRATVVGIKCHSTVSVANLIELWFWNETVQFLQNISPSNALFVLYLCYGGLLTVRWGVGNFETGINLVYTYVCLRYFRLSVDQLFNCWVEKKEWLNILTL